MLKPFRNMNTCIGKCILSRIERNSLVIHDYLVEGKFSFHTNVYQRYREAKSLSQKLDACLMKANSCSSSKRTSELEECLKELSKLISDLNISNDTYLMKEKSWNNLIQLFARSE